MQDLLAGADIGGGGGSRTKDNELAKVMFEGSQQHRRKLKLPDMNDAAEKIKEAASELSFFAFYDDKTGDAIGKYFFERFICEFCPPHGKMLLLCGRYRTTLHKRRQVAQELCDQVVNAVTEIYSGEDPETLIEAYNEGKKPVGKPGKKSARQGMKNAKVEEVKGLVASTLAKLARGTAPDLVDEIYALLKDELDEYYPAFKQSKYFELYARHRSMQNDHVEETDFHQFRVLGVGGFGSVNAAIKKDTGILLAVKRMDKKLIKHKNRYKSCNTEMNALQSLSSPFVCGLHYSYQTPNDVCLVLDLLHGGTLSFLLHQKKKVSERYVCFFTACIVMAYEALHSKGFVYRDMKPANVLLKENGYCVLIDFGLAAKMDTALKGKCGTRGYWAPEMVKGDQYLASGDWWSLGVTLIELLTGKKPFKKKFQKYKNTEDKVKIVPAGQVDDVIEEKNIESKLGKAKEIDDDGRDSNDEETDEEEEAEAAKKAGAAEGGGRRSSVRVIGGFDKTVESIVTSEAALEFFDAAVAANPNLTKFTAEGVDSGFLRLARIASIVTFDSETEIMLAGEFATFFCIVLEGKLRGDDGTEDGVGAIVGYEGLFKDNYHRQVKTIGGVQGGTLAIFLYSEMTRAELYDDEITTILKESVLTVAGKEGELETLNSTFAEFGDMEDTHAEERFIGQQKHTAKKDDAAAEEAKKKLLSVSKERDQKIYLTQEVWCKRDLMSRETQKFLTGMLTRDVNKRLGCGPGGMRNIKEHDFFEQIDWDRLEEGNATAPYIPKKEVNAKDEAKMKTFNTAGMKKLNKEDQDKWNEWNWTSTEYFQREMAMYCYDQWGETEYRKGGGGGGGGGCCEIS